MQGTLLIKLILHQAARMSRFEKRVCRFTFHIAFTHMCASPKNTLSYTPVKSFAVNHGIVLFVDRRLIFGQS
jgi:hypothetical protein